MIQRRLLIAGALASLLTVGCNLPGQVISNQPRVVVNYGSLELAPDADLAIVLDVRNLLGSAYKVQQATGASSIQKISAKVTGPNLVEPIVTSVNLIDCSSGLATLNFSNVPPGKVDVVVNAIDFDGKPVAWANGSAHIEPNKTARVPLRCRSTGGNLVIEFDCPELCGTTSPSPVPTPTPFNPPASLLNGITGFEVDDQQRVYLFGVDPAGTSTSPSHAGRVVRVLADKSVESMSVPFYNDNAVLADAEIIGGKFFAPLGLVSGGSNATHEIDTGSFPGALTKEYRNWIGSQYDILTADRNNLLLGFVTSTSTMEYVFLPSFPTTSAAQKRLFNWDLTSGRNDYYPHAMVVDKDNKLVWAAAKGICAPPIGPDRVTLPTILEPLPASLQSQGRGAWGIAETAPGANSYLITYDGDTRVFLWRQGSNQPPAPIADFAPDLPRKIERGPQGLHYILIAQKDSLDGYRLMTTKYRIISTAFDASTNQLTDRRTIVSTID